MSPAVGDKDKTPYQTAIDWIYEQKARIESAKYGRNKKSVLEAIEEQNQKAKVVTDYKKEVDKVSKTQNDEDKKHLQEAYDSLKDVSEKKLNCLQTMLGITSLEEHCVTLSNHFDNKAVELAEPAMKANLAAGGAENIMGFLAPSSQDCVFAAEDNWKWIVKLVNCIDTHLKNAANYHEYFHEVDESNVWLQEDIGRLNKSFEVFPISGEYSDAERLLRQLKDMAVSLRQWESRIDRMWHDACKVVPVHLRTKGVQEPTPARALVNYETRDVGIHEGEDLLLLDNSHTQIWTVRNGRGQEIDIPAVCVLIPGPFKDAVDAAVKMRLQLMTAWTDALKRMGQRLICFMLLVFKPDYQTEEIDVMRSIRLKDKTELNRILDFIEETLKTHWGDHEGFINLQERILMLRMILDQAGGDSIKDEAMYKALIVQISMLEELMKKYKDLWQDWEKYKVALEASRSPELMLIVDKWEQLQFVTRNHFSKFWKTELPFDEVEKSIAHLKTYALQSESIEPMDQVDEIDNVAFRKPVYGEHVGSFGEGVGSYGEGVGSYGEGQFEQATVRTTESMVGRGASAKNGQGSQGEGFDETLIKATTVSAVGSAPGRGAGAGAGSEGSGGSGVQRSALQGSEMFEEGMVEEGVSETTTGYEEARAGEGLEGGEFGYATTTKTAETEQILTADMEERKTFIIKSVIDPNDESSEISLNDAILQGIIKPEEGTYFNPVTGAGVPIPLAMSQGKIKVEFTSTRRSREKKSTIGIITVKTVKESVRPYNIIRAKDTTTDQWLSLEEADKKNILDHQHGFFISRKSGREMMITTAVERGLVEVEYIGEPQPAEVISQTYAVRAVVDMRLKKTITFQDALRRGIIDKENGAYKDTMTGESMYVGDAIMRGFVKARPVDDPTSLNIDPQNKMLVDKTEQIRRKVLKPLSVISAFKSAAKAKDGGK